MLNIEIDSSFGSNAIFPNQFSVFRKLIIRVLQNLNGYRFRGSASLHVRRLGSSSVVVGVSFHNTLQRTVAHDSRGHTSSLTNSSTKHSPKYLFLRKLRENYKMKLPTTLPTLSIFYIFLISMIRKEICIETNTNSYRLLIITQ